LAKKQEEERWRDIPEWKKNLILEKEKKKQEEMVGNSCPFFVLQLDDVSPEYYLGRKFR